MRTLSLGPSAEFPMGLWGHETCDRCAEVGAVPPSGRCPWGARRGSLWGHDPCDGCAEPGAVPPCGRCHWDLRRNSARTH
eukprot:315176-Pyramimonas_sp.AAC.1